MELEGSTRRYNIMTIMYPLVTIGLPMKNPGKLIDLAIRSVFAQTYSNWELIVVDDGSTDGSVELVRRIADERVTVVADGKNKGLPYRLNQITDMARGVFVARMDADDAMCPMRIAKQVEYLLSKPHLHAVTSGAILIDIDDRPVGMWPVRQPTRLEVLSRGGYLHPSLIARREWMLANKYSTHYPRAEDRDLFVRTLSTAKIMVVAEPLYFYRWFGMPRKSSLVMGYRSERKIMLRYGPSLVGWSLTTFLLAKSLAKEALTHFFGDLPFLRRASYFPIDPTEKSKLEHVLDCIKSTPVPGWD
jgi:glycosyltransferase involved in cell wall biosynthesis